MTQILRRSIAAIAATLLLANLSYAQEDYKSDPDAQTVTEHHGSVIRFASIPNASPDPNAPPNPDCIQSSCNCPAKEVECLPMSPSCEKPVAYELQSACGCGKSCGCNSSSCTSGGCGTDSCTSGCPGMCGTMCEDACRCGGVIFGYQHSFLKPHFTNSPGVPADVGANLGNLAQLVFATNPVGFDYDDAPEVWLGYENCDGLGILVRYWQFGEGSGSQTAINVPFQGVNATFSGRVDLRSYDIEVTERVEFCHWNFQFNEGVRYIDIRDSSRLFFATAPVGNGIVVDLANSRHNFHGTGPTVGLQAVRPIADSNFSFYADTRFSLLFGSSNSRTDFLDVLGNPQTAAADRDYLVSITELQVGLEWTHQFKRAGTFFIRGGMEGQVWYNAGNVASTDGDLGLYGGTLGFGLTR